MGFAVQIDGTGRHHIDLGNQAVPAIGIHQRHAGSSHDTDIWMDQHQLWFFGGSGFIDVLTNPKNLKLPGYRSISWIIRIEGMVWPGR